MTLRSHVAHPPPVPESEPLPDRPDPSRLSLHPQSPHLSPVPPSPPVSAVTQSDSEPMPVSPEPCPPVVDDDLMAVEPPQWQLTIINTLKSLVAIDNHGISAKVIEIINLCSNGDLIEAEAVFDEYFCSQFPCKFQPRAAVTKNRPDLQRSSKGMRRAQFAAMQALWERDTRRAAHMSLNGSWRSLHQSKRFPRDMTTFWRSVFERDSVPVSSVEKRCEPLRNLLLPVTKGELHDVVKTLSASSPGVDKVGVEDLKRLPFCEVHVFMLHFQLFPKLPQVLNISKVTFLEKVDSPTQSSQYRPIAVASIFPRVYHKIFTSSLHRGIPIRLKSRHQHT